MSKTKAKAALRPKALKAAASHKHTKPEKVNILCALWVELQNSPPNSVEHQQAQAQLASCFLASNKWLLIDFFDAFTQTAMRLGALDLEKLKLALESKEPQHE